MWIDSHCHTEDDDALQRGRAGGVTHFVVVGTDLETSTKAVETAARHADVFATVGLHPHDAKQLDDEWEQIVALVDSPKVVGIGEAGFDLFYEHSPVAEQSVAFERQIRLAQERDLPLVIHARDAWHETFEMLESVGVPRRTVFHCFTGGIAEARRALSLGCSLSYSGIVTFKNAEDLRAAAAVTPADRLLCETDAPFLSPVPLRGKPNEPAFIALVGAALAEARGETVEAVAEYTSKNAIAMFGLS